MTSDASAEALLASTNLFADTDVAAILRENGWLAESCEGRLDRDAALQVWLTRAAELLGPHVTDREGLSKLLSLVFAYDAAANLRDIENQAVLAREGARDVIRALANRILDGGDIDSDRFKHVIEGIKADVPYRSRAMFHPIRLALAGRAGEGELDRVILLLDAAAKLDFAVAVKGTRERMLEFCAALD